MCLEDQITMINARETFSDALGKCAGVGSTIKAVLRRALLEKRLTVGMLPAIQRLSAGSCDPALFCFLAPPRPADPAHHMQEVLLEAFCLENDIYIVKVDSAEKLHKMIPNYNCRDWSCILVHQPYSDPFSDNSPNSNTDHLSPPDKLLVDYCEQSWGVLPSPIIRLPEP